MKHLYAATLAAAMGLGASAAFGQTVCPSQGNACGFSISAPAALTLGASGPRRYQRITVGTGGDLWCTRANGIVPAVNGAGSFRIAAGGTEEFPIAGSAYVPTVPTVCVPASGTVTGSVETN